MKKLFSNYLKTKDRNSRPEVFCEKGVSLPEPFSNKLQALACNFIIKKETLVQVFSCEFC